MAMTRPALLLLALVAFFSRSLVAQDSSLGNCPCTLKGVVLNAVTGAPIRNALVDSFSGSSASVLTDSDGAFHFDNLPAGSASLTANKPGFLPVAPLFAPPPSFRVAPDAPDVVLKLVPSAVIRGRITDDRGLPIENLQVKLFRRPLAPSTTAPEQAGSVQTNDLGNFRIPDLPPGAYYLLIDPLNTSFHFIDKGVPTGFPRVYYPGVPDISAAMPIKVSAGREAVADLILTALPYVRVSGKITGSPPGVSVQAALFSPSNAENPVALEVDPQTGAFHSPWIVSGSYMLNAVATRGESKNGFASTLEAHQPVSVLSEVTGLTIALQPGVHVPVHISGIPGDESVAQIAVTAKSTLGDHADQASPADENSAAQATAEMWFESLSPGTYHLEISASFDQSYFIESARFGSTDLLASDFVVDSSASTRSIDIVFAKGGAAISGTVNLKDSARGAIVCLIPDKFGSAPLFDTAKGSGRFEFQDLAPGTYRIIAVDALSDVDFSSQEGRRKLASSATAISLTPSENLQLTLDVTAVKE